jgi:hypothetical protein
MQDQYRGTLGSFHRRLEIACRVQFLLARQDELRAFSQPERLRFMLADFHALWEKWDLAEPVYRAFLNNPRSSREIKACALRALGEAEQYQGARSWEGLQACCSSGSSYPGGMVPSVMLYRFQRRSGRESHARDSSHSGWQRRGRDPGNHNGPIRLEHRGAISGTRRVVWAV